MEERKIGKRLYIETRPVQAQPQQVRQQRHKVSPEMMNLQGNAANQPDTFDATKKYYGDVAKGYDKKRENTEKWKVEQFIIEEMLSQLPEGTVVLDVPCGTGRFFEFYQKKKFIVYGLDASSDMLNEAATKIHKPQQTVNGESQFRFAQGLVQDIKRPDKSIDVSVMCRLSRWLSPENCQIAFKELQRVTRDRIIITARVENPTHPQLARPLELFTSVLAEDWELAENAQGYVEAYRILMFRRKNALG